MTKQRKIIIGASSLGIAFMLTTLFLWIPRGSEFTVKAPAPPRDIIPPLLPPPVASTLTVKADLPVQDVKQLVESALREYLRKPIQWRDGAIDTAINLDLGTLTMTSTGDGTVSIKTPFTFKGWVRASKKAFGRVIERRENFEGQATVLLTLTPRLNPDWGITAQTTSDISIQQAEIQILGITISVRRILTELVREKVLPKLEELIVKHITNIDVKTRVAGLWAKLYEPIVLNQEPPIALVIEPLAVLAQKLSSDGETLSVSLGINTYIQVKVGAVSTDFSALAGPRADLPNIQFVDSLESGYHIIAPIDVTYVAIENLARPHVEKRHKLKGIETLVENLTLYGSGAQLAAGVGFNVPSLGAKGQLYMLGTPVYDAPTMSLSVSEFNYSLTTQSLLLEIADRVGEGVFPNLRTAVEERLVFPLEAQMTTLHEKLSAVIAERRIGRYILLRGTVETITPEGLYLTQEGVRLAVHLQGNLACEVTLDAKSNYTPPTAARGSAEARNTPSTPRPTPTR